MTVGADSGPQSPPEPHHNLQTDGPTGPLGRLEAGPVDLFSPPHHRPLPQFSPVSPPAQDDVGGAAGSFEGLDFSGGWRLIC